MAFGPPSRLAHPIAASVCSIAGIAAVASAFCLWLGPAGFVQTLISGGLLIVGFGLFAGFVCYNFLLLAFPSRR